MDEDSLSTSAMTVQSQDPVSIYAQLSNGVGGIASAITGLVILAVIGMRLYADIVKTRRTSSHEGVLYNGADVLYRALTERLSVQEARITSLESSIETIRIERDTYKDKYQKATDELQAAQKVIESSQAEVARQMKLLEQLESIVRILMRRLKENGINV